MNITTKFDHWDRVYTEDKPDVEMQITGIQIECVYPYYPKVSYKCQEITTAKMHLVREKNLLKFIPSYISQPEFY